MNSRRKFRPVMIEGLEDRKLMSRAGASEVSTHAAMVHAEAAPKVPLGAVGTLGDSFTDEYRFYPPHRTQARNWVEILSATRGVNFGSFTTKSRGEPRNAGFAYNWARSDAKTADMVRNQLPGLTAQVAKGQVRDVVILIGGNDFLLPLESIAKGTLSPAAYAASLPEITAEAGANLQKAVDTLRAARSDVRMVIATIDISDLPIVRGVAALSPALQPLVQAVNQAVGEYNDSIRALVASTPRATLVDLAAINQQLGQAPAPTIPFGGAMINLATVGDNFHDFFLADGIHPGTVAQGVIANLFLDAFDTRFGTSVPELTPREIVRFAAKAQTQVKQGHPGP